MNRKPIEEARTPELRDALPALRRAARRAREVAASTGTRLIIARNGSWEAVAPADVLESTEQ